ncbi:MAG: MBL fold metallo-hydrolase [Candidatus Aenigmarchaeota archaeon]|nr:MBL fold metallo-hydrolase [Candidatus Aenigmarchaeota archaeon]
MKLTVLGCGTVVPELEKHMAGHLLEIDGKKYLFDAGPGTVYQILKAKVDIRCIDHMFFTHFHNDHISDLPALIWVYHSRLKRERPLNLYGPPGFVEYADLLSTKIIRAGELECELNPKEHDEDEFEVDGMKISTKKMKHMETIGYRVEHKGKVFVYTGDTAFFPGLIEFAKGADVFLCECALLKENVTNNLHMIPEECGRVAKEAGVKNLVLTHMYPETTAEKTMKIVKKTFDGEVIIAKDLMTIEM